ncbi:MAG: 3-phosphoserine/phosphohydroxythreonine transaminase [Bacteroidales bacterium]|nr:3-phosphoserine/phosphohydroxythreonine transaminase [Bacteroidales bacterium]
MKKHNFNAGPSVLPKFTIENTAKNVLDLEGTGLSIMEISHRSKEFSAIMDESVALMKELLDVPSGYSVLFLHGGASLQFCMIPYNLLNKKAAYLETGSWSSKAIKEAKMFGEVEVVASSKEQNYNFIPRDFRVSGDAEYLHITTNNTIYGTEIKEDIEVPVPLVADTSSDILSRPMDVSKYGLIYGGAQKNLGPAGLAYVIIKDDILGKVDRTIPTILNYKTHIENGSLYNTPPCLAIYASLQTLKWLKGLGGLKVINKMNTDKANMLYDEIERNKLFVSTVKNPADRSIMNVTFVMNENYKDKEADFLQFAVSKGMVGIKGHRSVGGFRASLYNALPKESVIALIDAMKEFEAKA